MDEIKTYKRNQDNNCYTEEIFPDNSIATKLILIFPGNFAGLFLLKKAKYRNFYFHSEKIKTRSKVENVVNFNAKSDRFLTSFLCKAITMLVLMFQPIKMS